MELSTLTDALREGDIGRYSVEDLFNLLSQ